VTVNGQPESAGFLSYAGPPAPVAGSPMQVRAEWTGFYDAHYHRVVRFLVHMGASRAEAEEAAQEAFIESWTLMERDPDHWNRHPRKEAWIRTVALRRYRRPPGPRRRPLVTGAEIPDVPAPGPGHDELTVQTQFVLRALQVLDEEARAVMAFDMDDFPAADIALELGITQQRVWDVKKRARAALRKELTVTMSCGRRQP
jgi:RNA polymerase sigma factor (sigma-70 family)